MEFTWLQEIATFFKNLTLGSNGARKSIYELMEEKKVDKVLNMLTNRDAEVDEALQEYNPALHEVMRRRNKELDDGDVYITEKLPRTRERYINEVELFFLLGENIKWKKVEGDDDAYGLFTEYLKETFFNSKIRQCKRLAGAETMSALVTHFYRKNDNTIGTDVFVAARSTGYRLRYLFDQYKRLMCLAYGYTLKEDGKNVRYWEILTEDVVFVCRKSNMGWQVDPIPNPSGKINAILFLQPKSWAGAEQRLKRDEMLDSKIGDTNNYFADPIAAATADVIASMPRADKPGRMIQMPSEKSQFKYIAPPLDSETRRDEKENLNATILFDTFTPDFSFEKMKGLGSLSGVAIRNAMILGYIKRANRLEVYEEMITRYMHLTLKVLTLIYPEKKSLIDQLKIEFEFADPFPENANANWQGIINLYNGGVCSLETAVTMLALTKAPQEEIEKIKLAAQEKAEMEAIIKNGGEDNPNEQKTEGENT